MIESMSSEGKQNIANMFNVFDAAFTGIERLTALNLGAARSFLESNIANTKALLAAKDYQEAASLQAAFVKPTVEKGIAYSRGVYEIVAQSQKEMTKFLETQMEAMNHTLTETLEKVGRSAPNGMEAVVNMMKSAVNASNTTYENLTKATKQFADMAEANLSEAADATNKAFSNAIKGGKK